VDSILFGGAETIQRSRTSPVVERPRASGGELISRPVVSVARTQLVRDAVDLMRRRGYSQLPVFEGGRSVGSVSEKTILDRRHGGVPRVGAWPQVREIMIHRFLWSIVILHLIWSWDCCRVTMASSWRRARALLVF